MAFWAAAAPILAQVGTSVLNNIMSHFSTQQANQMSYDQSVKLWNMNNDYNKPVNQMKRLEEAGLNPFLVYGNGATGNTSAQPSSPSVQSPRYQFEFLQGLMASKQLQLMNQQINSAEKKNELLDYQLGNLEFYKRTGLPLNSPWYAAWLMDIISDPVKVNKLKKIGMNIGEFLGDVLTAERPQQRPGTKLDVNYGFLPDNPRLNVDDDGNFILE